MSPEAAAENYDALSRFQFQDGCHLISQLLKPQSGESILDVGCGTGIPTMVLAQQVTSSGRIVGVDPTAYRISVAQKKLTESGNKHVTFMEGTCADAIPLGLFDAVFSNYMYCNGFKTTFPSSRTCTSVSGLVVDLHSSQLASLLQSLHCCSLRCSGKIMLLITVQQTTGGTFAHKPASSSSTVKIRLYTTLCLM